jgi:hypothetical protein
VVVVISVLTFGDPEDGRVVVDLIVTTLDIRESRQAREEVKCVNM